MLYNGVNKNATTANKKSNTYAEGGFIATVKMNNTPICYTYKFSVFWVYHFIVLY